MTILLKVHLKSSPYVDIFFPVFQQIYALFSFAKMDPYFFSPGVEKFKGEIIHSSAYKNPEKYQDQRILLIGMGSSGIEIAIDLSHITKQVQCI